MPGGLGAHARSQWASARLELGLLLPTVNRCSWLTQGGHVPRGFVLVGELPVSERPPRAEKCCLVTPKPGRGRCTLQSARASSKLRSGVSASAVGWKFNVKEPTYP